MLKIKHKNSNWISLSALETDQLVNGSRFRGNSYSYSYTHTDIKHQTYCERLLLKRALYIIWLEVFFHDRGNNGCESYGISSGSQITPGWWASVATDGETEFHAIRTTKHADLLANRHTCFNIVNKPGATTCMTDREKHTFTNGFTP